MKKILLIDSHPYDKSLCKAIADSYETGALQSKDRIEINRINIRDLRFDTNLRAGYRESQELEGDLEKAKKLVEKCQHIVLVVPVWWGGVPALLKGFFDRLLLPGWTFEFDENHELIKLLTGRSASVLYTQGASEELTRSYFKDCFWESLSKYVFNFCGFDPIQRVCFDSVEGDSEEKNKYRADILVKAEKLGQEGF